MAYIGNSPETTYSINVKEYVATAGQTIFPAVYGAFVEVYVNGLLLASTDYTATDGVQVILNVGATAGDEVRINGYADIATASGLVTSVAGKTGNVVLDKADVGLTNVDNTADADKPISTAQAAAIGNKQDTLVSDTNIKTINGSSILGSGNINTPTTNVNNTLTSTSITEALSAAQGKVLQDTKAGLASVVPLAAGTATVGTSTLAARQDHVHPTQTTITGNAATATKLATARSINGVSFDGSANIYIEERLRSPIASAATITIGTAGLGETIHITGTTSISSLGVSTTGTRRTLVFDGALVLVHNATSLILPTSANITTAVGDTAEFICENGASGYWRCVRYDRVSGSPLVGAASFSDGGIGSYAMLISAYSSALTLYGSYAGASLYTNGLLFNSNLDTFRGAQTGTWKFLGGFYTASGSQSQVGLFQRIA